MLPIVSPGYAMICFLEVSKGVITHNPFGFTRVSKSIKCVMAVGNAKTDIWSIFTIISLRYKFKIIPVNISLNKLLRFILTFLSSLALILHQNHKQFPSQIFLKQNHRSLQCSDSIFHFSHQKLWRCN